MPTSPGESCNDFDSNTENDLIQPDGCTCAGAPITNTCNINVILNNREIIITGLTGGENTKLFDSTVSTSGIVWSCDPWNGSPCTGIETITGLSIGETYFLSVQSDICEEWIPITYNGAKTDAPTSRNSVNTTNNFEITNLFPNPTSAEAFLKVESSFDGLFMLEIYDIVGRLKGAKSIELQEGNNTIDLEANQLVEGTYNVLLSNDQNTVKQVRFIKLVK